MFGIAGLYEASAHGTGGFADIYINAGGGAFTDSAGNLWIADTLYNTGNTWISGAAISGTTDEAIYQSERWDPGVAPELQYAITVPNGDYEVIMHFADIYGGTHSVGARVFDVSIEGALVLDDLDIYSEVGGNAALTKTITTTVNDGVLTINFGHEVENPKIAGIEIHQLSQPVPFISTTFTSLLFPATEAGTVSAPETVTVSNIGALDLTISDLRIVGPNAGDFSFNFNDGDSFVLTPQQSLDLIGSFSPTQTGIATATIEITSNSVAGPQPYAITAPGTPGGVYDLPGGEVVPSVSIASINGDAVNGYDLTLATSNFSFVFFDPMGLHVPGEGHAHLYIDGIKQGRMYAPTTTLPSMIPGNHTIEVRLSTNNHLEYQSVGIPISDSQGLQVPETITQIQLSGEGVATTPPATAIYINTGGPAYTDSLGNIWQADTFFNTGNAYISGSAISGTTDDPIYQSERWDPGTVPELQYAVPVPNGDYDVTLHFADIFGGTHSVGARVFDVSIEGALVLDDLDIYSEVGGNAALTKTISTTVSDGELTIDFGHVVENPKIAGIEIHSTSGGEPGHLAHAVPGAPQTVVDADFSGFEDVTLDGSFSHTHEFGESLSRWTWSIGTTTIASGEVVVVALPVGIHTVTLEVEDGAGNIASDVTTITVANGSVPNIVSLSPSEGDLAGGTLVTINGSGFTASAAQTIVHFGGTQLTGGQLTIIDQNTIEVFSPAGAGTVGVSVQTPAGISTGANYTYIDPSLPPVQFITGTVVQGITGPTTLAFGPDKRLYVGTQFGDLYVLTLDSNYNVTNTVVSSVIQTSEPTFRSILGIAFDPFDIDPINPRVYVAHSNLFHGQAVDIYTGKISTLSGAAFDVKEDIITGLPVSDHDHGINGLEFDNDGNLYMQVGGNTNAGVPGALSSSGTLDEVALSAATLKAPVQDPSFNGVLTYDGSGNQTGGDVSVFAGGQRNPYDILLHSNGWFYGTDNGPNSGFGQKSVGCSAEGTDPSEGDELNRIVEGGYYGHANRFRGQTDPRECVWHSINDPSTADYTAPIATFPASTNGITEYRADTFAGQLRGALLLSRWTGELFNVELSADGLSVINNTTLISEGGLDVVVGPDGTIFIVQNVDGEIIYHAPDETPTGNLTITNTFPYRGPLDGGNELSIFGNAFTDFGSPTVTVGGQACGVTSSTNTEITCTLNQGAAAGAYDVVVSAGGQNDTFANGYTYIGEITTPPPPPPATGVWSALANAPASIGEVSSVTDGTYVYLLGGQFGDSVKTDQLYRYDPATGTWTTLAPQTVVPTVDHGAAHYSNGKIYFFGGLINNFAESNALGIYDIATDSWSTGAPLTIGGQPYGIGSAASAIINGKLYVAGGIHNENQAENTTVTVAYDPATDSWSQLADMPSGRNHAAGGTYNGKLYVFAGRQGPNIGSPGFNDTFIYDPATDTWTTGASVPTARSGMGNAPELNGELYVIGGEVGGPFAGTFEEVEVYDPTTDTWRTETPITTPRHGIWPVTLNGRIHVIAGGVQEGLSTSDVHELFSPDGTPPPTPTSTEIRINAGGGEHQDGGGNTWSADSFFNTGNAYATGNPISGTTEDILYQTERWDLGIVPELTYNIPVDNGTYLVTLHFADIFPGTHSGGARVFDIEIEGVELETDLDIYSQVGGFAALTKSYQAVVTDDALTITFLHQVENPKVSAIEAIKQ